MTWKNTIADIFGIETYEDRVKVLDEKCTMLATENVRLEKEMEDLKDNYYKLYHATTEPQKFIDDRIKELEAQYRKAAESCESALNAMEKKVKNHDGEVNRAYANGRRDAYAQMGIICIDAHRAGQEVVATFGENGHAESMQVVTKADAQLLQICDEIDIDDLVEVTP